MHSIGELARASGLSVSALRFYDQAGLLVPAHVDPHTGYRWYSQDQLRPARLVAALRRVGMPLPDIARVLAARDDPAAVRRILDAHLCRLEDGLADARRVLSRVHTLIDHEEKTMTTRLTLAAEDLAAAIGAVRFAAGADPELPALHGILLDIEDETVRLVATDRYRMAVAEAPIRDRAGPATSRIAPTRLLDRARACLDTGDVTLVVDGPTVRLESPGWRVEEPAVDHEFPDYHQLLRLRATSRVTVDVAALRDDLTKNHRQHGGIPYDVSVLALDGAEGVAVNREFLFQALAATGRGQLVLELDGPIAPLAIRIPDDDRTYSILMPVRLPA